MAGLWDIQQKSRLAPAVPKTDRERTQAEFEADADAAAAAQYGDFGGGASSAIRGMAGSTKAYAASILDTLGAKKAAKGLYAAAQRDAQRAQAIAPEIATTDQIDDTEDALRYVIGKVGSAAGSIPPALLGGVAGRLATRSGLGAGLGATAAYQPTMAGQHVQELNANPNTAGMGAGEKLARATGLGTAQAAFEGLGPAYMANRFFRHASIAPTPRAALREGAKTLAIDAGLEGAGAAASDVLGQAGMIQADPTVRFDPRQTFEAGLGEAIGGAGIGVPHAAVTTALDYARARDQGVAQDIAQGVQATAPRAIDAGRNAAQTAADVGALFKSTASGYLKHPELARLVAQQELPPELEGASAGEIADWLAQDDGQRHQAALKIAQRTLIDREASDTAKQVAQQLIDNPADPESWKAFSSGMIVEHQQRRLGAKIGQAGADLKAWLGKRKSNLEPTPDDVEFGDAMREPLARALGVDDQAGIDEAAKLLQDYVMSDFALDAKGEPRVPDGLVAALGERAPEILAQTYDTLRRQGRTKLDDATAEKRLAAVGKLVKEKLSRFEDAGKIVERYLTPTMLRQVPPDALADIGEGARAYLRRGTTDKTMEHGIYQLFGRNAETALEKLRALDPKGHETTFDPNEGATDAGETNADDAGSDQAADDRESPLTETPEPRTDYHFKGAKGAEAFDRKDVFLARNLQLAKDRIGPEATTRYNKDLGVDEPFTQEVGVAKHARETGVETTLQALREAHPELSDAELDKRFFVLRSERPSANARDELDIDPSELATPATKKFKPNKASWRDVATVQSKEGNRDVSTIEHGRIYLIPGKPAVKRYVDEATGEELPPGRGGKEIVDEPAVRQGKEFLTSAQKLITKMWERGFKSDGTPQGKLAAFAAGLSSLQATGQFTGEMQVKMPDGTLKAVNSFEDLPDNFVLYQSNGEVTTLGQARANKFKSGPAQKMTEEITVDDIPNMTRSEIAALGTRLKEELSASDLSPKTRNAKVKMIEALREAYDKRVAERAPGEKRETAGNVGERVVDRQPDGKSRGSRAEHHGIGESEEIATAQQEKLDNTARRFQEETGLELHPKEPLSKDKRLKLIDEQIPKLRKQYADLAAKIKEYEAKPGRNVVREGNLRAWRKELAGIVAKGRELAAKREVVVRSSLEKTGSTPLTKEQEAEISAYIEKVLGPQVAVLFTNELKGSGEWSRDAQNQNAAIKIATTALNPLSVAHHEAMHEFFQRLLDGGHDKAADALRKAASGALIQRQLERHFASQPEVLKQIENDVEERIAYMYQLWASDMLRVGDQTESVFRSIANFMRKLFGLLSEEQKLNEILEYFHDGALAEPGALAHFMDSAEARGAYVRKVGAIVDPVLKRGNEWLGFAESALTGSDNPHLDWIGRQFHNKVGVKGDEQGYLSAKDQANNRYMNKFARALEGVDPTGKDKRTATKEDVDLALEGLQTKTWHDDPVVRRVQEQVAGVFEEMYQYMKDRGVKVFNPETEAWEPVKKVKDYRIPVSWDPAKIIEKSGEFKALLLEHHKNELDRIAEKANAEAAKGQDAGKYTASWQKKVNGNAAPVTAENVAEAIVNRLINSNGQQDVQESTYALGYSPFAKAVNERTLHWIDQKIFHEFQEKDVVKIISHYVGQVTKRGEYSHRFGAGGEVLQEKMEAAFAFEVDKVKSKKPELSDDEVKAQAVSNLEPARRAVMAMEGTLGHDISPILRKVSSYTIVYENVRLLGYSLFSNIIDPLGMMVNGGEFKDSYAAFKRGMRDVFREWGDLTGVRTKRETDDDEAVRVAELIGTVDSSGFMSQMGTLYGSQYLSPWARDVNNSFFRWNGLEAFNRAMRVQATQAAIGFIKKHHTAPNAHSERYFKELGLEQGDVAIGENGALNIEHPKVQQAVMRWVDGSILRPNAAMRPTMASDPHYAIFYHLKQFMYAMHATILKRVQTELKHGNNDPIILLLAGYVPVMLAADAAKGLLQEATGNGAPYWQHESMGGIVAHGVQRAGLLGIGQMVPDTLTHGPLDLAGPAVEQVADAATEPVGTTVGKALGVGPLSMFTKGGEVSMEKAA